MMLSLKMIISSEIMEFILRPMFNVLTVPDLKIKKPSWIAMPSPWTIFAFILLSYFLVTGGIIYDVIVEPPSVGSTTDEHGHQRPVAFMPYRVNGEKKIVSVLDLIFTVLHFSGQYIMEGLASSFMFSLGGAGMIILDQTHNPNTPKLNRMLLQFVGFAAMVISFGCCWVFMRMKLPGYMLS